MRDRARLACTLPGEPAHDRVTVRPNGLWAGEISFAGLTLTQSLS